jgi:hypothetical protein
MTTSKKVVLSLSILTILGVGGYLAYAYYKRKKGEAVTTPSNEEGSAKVTTQPTQQVTQTTTDSPFPLSRGSRGANVVSLQTLLNKLGDNLDTDGVFGKNTEDAIKRYAGIPMPYKNQYPAFSSGVVDIQGFNWLKNKLAQKNLSSNPLNIFR